MNYAGESGTQEPLYEFIAITLFIIIGYFLQIEVRQCIVNYKEYFSQVWNLSDLVSYSLCFLVVFLDVFNFNKAVLRPVGSLALIILWIKLFYFLRVYDSTSQLIRMIIEIVNDMRHFMMVLFIGIIGFTSGLYIMQHGLPEYLDPEQTQPNPNYMFVGNTFFNAFIYTYRLTLGDFQLDAFADFEQAFPFEYFFLWIIFISGSLFLVIVLLNLLIAIMGSTFERISEGLADLSIREKALLVSENESLFSREQLFKKSQYLVIISEKTIEASNEDSVEGKIAALKT